MRFLVVLTLVLMAPALALAAAPSLFEAVHAGDVARIDTLLNNGADIEAIDDHGWTPLG